MWYRRDGKRDNRWLFWKVTAFFLAAGLWLAGAVADQEWLVWAAGGVLATALLIRLLNRGEGDGHNRDA